MFELDHILASAVAHGASDIHLKSHQRPYIRLNRALVDIDKEVIQPQQLMSAIMRILPVHLRKTFEEDHEADFSYVITGLGRFRCNAFLAQGVPVLTMRSVKTAIPNFADLNLPTVLGTISEARRGIIIIAGTTGSGKSTTLAAIIEHMNENSRRRIVTVEDPVEYVFTDRECVITQREVGQDTDSFEQALKHILRQDPDVIVIGEMRDLTSLKTALMAAETGHLVITTLHAATAAVAIPRMLELFPNEEWEHTRLVFASVLQAVICQRLLRGAAGGMIPAVEVMLNTPVVRHTLEQNKLDLLAESIEGGSLDGMQSFNQSLHQLISSGKITEEEGLKHATSSGALRMALGGISSSGRRILMR